jgi:hypothetical protein
VIARAEARVPLAPPAAFEAFADLGAWWPPEFSWSGPGALQSIQLDPRAGRLATEGSRQARRSARRDK